MFPRNKKKDFLRLVKKIKHQHQLSDGALLVIPCVVRRLESFELS